MKSIKVGFPEEYKLFLEFYVDIKKLSTTQALIRKAIHQYITKNMITKNEIEVFLTTSDKSKQTAYKRLCEDIRNYNGNYCENK